jgi:hypothetical protein
MYGSPVSNGKKAWFGGLVAGVATLMARPQPTKPWSIVHGLSQALQNPRRTGWMSSAVTIAS